MGKKKKEFPPSKEMNFHFRMTKELCEVLRTDAASADMTLSDYNTHSIISSFSRYISGALHIIHSSFISISYLPKASINELASLITFLFRE